MARRTNTSPTDCYGKLLVLLIAITFVYTRAHDFLPALATELAYFVTRLKMLKVNRSHGVSLAYKYRETDSTSLDTIHRSKIPTLY